MDLRNIDAAVAEKVMGWHNNWDNPGRGGMWGIMDWIIEDDGSRTPVRVADFPCYSSDIAAAWEVVDKLRPGGSQSFSLCRLHSLGGVWQADFAGMTLATEATAPLAICMAALRVKGVELEALL